MYRQGIEVKRDCDVGIMIEKASWLPVIEALFDGSEKIYYPNDQDDVVYFNVQGKTVAVISGQGSSMAACMAERLRVYGAKVIVRIGTCGALSRSIRLWDPIITIGCISDEGTSSHYLPAGFPIIPNPNLSHHIAESLAKVNIDYQQGITVTTDGRWRENSELMKQLSGLGVVSIEMETSAILAVCQFRGIHAAAVNLPADLPADEDTGEDFKGIPDRTTYRQNLENALKRVFPPVVRAAVDYRTLLDKHT